MRIANTYMQKGRLRGSQNKWREKKEVNKLIKR